MSLRDKAMKAIGGDPVVATTDGELSPERVRVLLKFAQDGFNGNPKLVDPALTATFYAQRASAEAALLLIQRIDRLTASLEREFR